MQPVRKWAETQRLVYYLVSVKMKQKTQQCVALGTPRQVLVLLVNREANLLGIRIYVVMLSGNRTPIFPPGNTLDIPVSKLGGNNFLSTCLHWIFQSNRHNYTGQNVHIKTPQCCHCILNMFYMPRKATYGH